LQFVCAWISELPHNKHYDLVVIGGGSGGLACAKEGNCAYSCKTTMVLTN